MTDKKALKNKYQTDISIVRRLVNEFDPSGLISAGAPDDEYDALNNQILSHIYNNTHRETIRAFILDMIQNYFGVPDLAVMKEPYKSEFYHDLDKLLDDLHVAIGHKA